MLSKERHEEQRWKHLPFPKQLGSPPGLQTGFTGGSVLLLTQEMDVHTSPISIEGRCLLNFPTRWRRKRLLKVSHEVTEGCAAHAASL